MKGLLLHLIFFVYKEQKNLTWTEYLKKKNSNGKLGSEILFFSVSLKKSWSNFLKQR